jgi:acetyltransferase-like isoleucine patch superfamily enzyme
MGAHVLGDFKDQPRCFLPKEYFEGRDCWLDCRVKDMLRIDERANIGWCVSFVTMTHNVNPGMFGEVQGRPIIIHKDAFIAYGAMLYNCEIGEGSVVAMGTVVRSQVVPPRTKVAGNPARIIETLDENGKWVKTDGELKRMAK